MKKFWYRPLVLKFLRDTKEYVTINTIRWIKWNLTSLTLYKHELLPMACDILDIAVIFSHSSHNSINDRIL